MEGGSKDAKEMSEKERGGVGLGRRGFRPDGIMSALRRFDKVTPACLQTQFPFKAPETCPALAPHLDWCSAASPVVTDCAGSSGHRLFDILW